MDVIIEMLSSTVYNVSVAAAAAIVCGICAYLAHQRRMLAPDTAQPGKSSTSDPQTKSDKQSKEEKTVDDNDNHIDERDHQFITEEINRERKSPNTNKKSMEHCDDQIVHKKKPVRKAIGRTTDGNALANSHRNDVKNHPIANNVNDSDDSEQLNANTNKNSSTNKVRTHDSTNDGSILDPDPVISSLLDEDVTDHSAATASNHPHSPTKNTGTSEYVRQHANGNANTNSSKNKSKSEPAVKPLDNRPSHGQATTSNFGRKASSQKFLDELQGSFDMRQVICTSRLNRFSA